MTDFEVGSDEFDNIINKMTALCAGFAKLVDDFDQTLGPLQAGFHALKLTQILKMLDILTWLKDVGEEIQKYKGREGGTLERIANEMMIDDEIEAIQQDGYNYKPDTQHCYSISKVNKDAFMDWAHKDPVAKELITETIHHKTLEKYLNGLREDGKPLPGTVTHFEKPVIKRRKCRS